MIILDTTTRKLQIKMGADATTTQPDFVVSYVDITTTTFAPAAFGGILNGTTAVDVVGTPPASTQRQVKFLSVVNLDSVTQTISVLFNDNAVVRILAKIALPSNYQLEYNGQEFVVKDGNGALASGAGAVTSVFGRVGAVVAVSGDYTAAQIASGAALTKVDDTNVTLTLGGTPTAALLAASSLTLGWTGTLAVARGGTGAGTFTAHGIMLGEGTGALVPTALMTDGQLLVGQSAADPLPKTLSGDATLAASGVITLASTIVAAGPVGDATHVAAVTFDAKGRLTVVSSVAITYTSLTSFSLRDTTAAFDVTIGATSSPALGAGRILTLDMGNVAHTLAFGTTANTITFPNVASDTVVMLTAAQTITGKSIAASQITAGTFAAGTFSLSGSTITTLGTVQAGSLAGLTKLGMRDTTGAFDVIVATTSSPAISADRTLTLDVGNVAHTVQLGTTANTITFPNAASGTVPFLNLAQTWTALQSFGTNLGGTLQTAAQPNITSLGTLTSLTMGGTIAGGGNQLNNIVIGTSTPLAGTFTALTGTSGSLTGLTGLALRDTTAAFDVTLAATSSPAISAGRILTLNMGNVAHTLAFGATANTITFPSAASDTVDFLGLAQTFTAKKSWNFNTAALISTSITGENMLISGADATANVLTLVATGAATPQLLFVRQNGTGAAPTTVASGNFLGAVGFLGYDGLIIDSTNFPAVIRARAAENFTNVAHGTDLQVSLAAIGAVTSTLRLKLYNSGALSLSSVDTDPGTAGVLNLAVGLRIVNAAASGNVLRGNGINFVSAALTAADITAGTFAAGTFSFSGSTLTTIGTVSAGSLAGLTKLGIRDTTAGFDVIVAATSSPNISADRTLTLDMGNVAHTVKFGTTANTITFPNVASDTVTLLAATQTLTNKAITSREVTVTSSATVTVNADTTDIETVTAQAAAVVFANPTGTPLQGQKLIIRIKDNGTARAITYGTQFRAGTDVALPTTTVLSKTLYMGFIFNSTDTKWDILAKADGF